MCRFSLCASCEVPVTPQTHTTPLLTNHKRHCRVAALIGYKPQSQIAVIFFTLYIFIKFPAFKKTTTTQQKTRKTNNIRCKTVSWSSGKRFLAPRILCWFHLFQPAGKWIESLTCSASREALWVRTTVWFSLCDFRPWADILTEIKHTRRTYMSSTL